MSYNLFHNLPELARKGGFALCDGSDDKNDVIDWRFIASIDTARIISESDYEKLDQCIPFLIRSSVGNLLNVRILDPAIARIYIISQLCLQYLLFCTKFLDKSVYSLRENIFSYQKTTVKLEENLAQRDEEITQLTKKLKRHDALNQTIFSCTKCTKNFLSAALLENHIQRKHPPILESKDKDSNLINTIKLELEIKQLKEKLNATEKELNVTEKELMNLNHKQPMECEKCKINSRKIFQNAAVQSNFEEKEKDDVEKDAIYELLNNQMRNFEEWKREEETRYRSEILELRTKLDDTIQELKQNSSEPKVQAQPPSPAPRLLVAPEKTASSSILKPAEKPDESLWKDRYKELEKMYEDNQQRMALTVTSIEATYNEKMTKFEESVKNLMEEREKFQGQACLTVEKKPKVPLTPRVIKSIYAQDISSESSLSDYENEIEVIPAVKKSTELDKIEEAPEVQVEKTKSIMETFAAQKFMIRTKKPKPQPMIFQQSLKPLKNPRDEAQKLFNQRLKSLGISQEKERMRKLEFEDVHNRMVTKREENKGKHKSFFITRKNLKSKVEKIFSQKHKTKETVNKTKQKKEMAYAKPKKETADSGIASKSNIDEKSPKVSSNRKFKDDLEQILEKRLSTAPTIKNLSNQVDEVLQNSKDTFLRQQTTPKSKKVLFDMKHLNENAMREQNDEDSDFDISSFSNFTADEDK